MRQKLFRCAALLLVVVANFGVWTYLNKPQFAPAWDGTMMGVSFSPMGLEHNPMTGILPSEEEIDRDLGRLAGKTHAVRIYSVTNGLEAVPGLAEKHHLNVTAGAWISTDEIANEMEIDNLIKLSNRHRNIVRALVGNEAILRGEVTVEQMIGYLRQVRKKIWRPFSTSEPWHIWIAHPELAKEVDFIAAHILPYWEGIPVEQAVDYTFERYQALKKAFPDKPIVITEAGWPSGGQSFRQSEPSLVNQATYLRNFLNRAYELDVLYYVVEAFDQPWKKSIEGSSGAYWGLFNAERHPKFPMKEMVLALPGWRNWATLAAFTGAVLMILFLLKKSRLGLRGKFFFAVVSNLAASAIAWTASVGALQYHTEIGTAMWFLLLAMQALAVLVLLVESLEIAEVLWHRKGTRSFIPLCPSENFAFPKVSLHLPIHNEPPEMVEKTLLALARLDYPDYEVLVLDNNTKDPEIWKPVRDYCAKLGERFRFFHLENWPGFKAGALNYGLTQTAGDAGIIAVIDSDYIVDPSWLKQLVPYFEKPDVGFVQAPQDYRDGAENLFKSCCYWEYAGFFKLGMVQRNEFNAIIQHGTMTMIRKSAFEKAGNWGEWCICEDSEFGLRLYRQGYDSVYIKDSFGRGLTPDNLRSYMTQRFRWVYGAMQILKGHWRAFLPGKKSGLTAGQRYYFFAGWLPWMSDALALLFTLASLALTAPILIDPKDVELPVVAFVLPTIGLFWFKIFRSLWLYQARVKCSPMQTLGAMVAGLALTHTVAKGVWVGLFTSRRPFIRTPKCERTSPILAGFLGIRQEILLLSLLLMSAGLVGSLEHFNNTTGKVWIAVLLVQAIPYAATLITLLTNVWPAALRPRIPVRGIPSFTPQARATQNVTELAP
ncbi:MAG: glycosyltransferase [Methylococcales bacterium]